MSIRIATAIAATTMICACSQGQKERVPLQNEMDSVSYAIGVDIGSNFKRSKLDSANLDAMRMGMRDGLDSAAEMDQETVQSVIQSYMQKLQEAKLAEEAKKGEENRVAGETFLAENAKRKGVVTTPSGLQYEVITMGKGPKPMQSDTVTVHYVGSLVDGTVFQSSVEMGRPMTHPVAQFVPGWTEALQLMPVGSKWKVFIPSDLGYGSRSEPGSPIPANSTLIFELELLDIVKK